MEMNIESDKISLEKELTVYDDLALEFTEVLHRHDTRYAFVSGYLAILFGRSRISDDIDMLAERMTRREFLSLWKNLSEDFYCHNTDDPEDAFTLFLEEGFAIRFSLKGEILPNVEYKWASTRQQRRAVENSLALILNGRSIRISSLEMQISYKLYLGSDKDLEDAIYLFELFRDAIDLQVLREEIGYLDIDLEEAKDKLRW